jgi:hypothetical protein
MDEKNPSPPMQTCPDNSPNEAVHAGAGAHVNVVRLGVERDALMIAWSMIAVALVAIAVAAGAWSRAQNANERATIADRDATLEQYYIMELDAKLIAAGFTPPNGGYAKWKLKHEEKAK